YKVFGEIGEKVGLMHNNGIIHQDLTTSNMIMHSEKKKVFLIDFGLSFFSVKEEDKAVDLHLLRRAVESRHHEIVEECFSSFVDGYKKTCLDAELVLKRLEKVESRGRNKGKH
ncbi:lipopolysaccharide kinase InaA family protein, partial [Nanoarchaeota archaeon]